MKNTIAITAVSAAVFSLLSAGVVSAAINPIDTFNVPHNVIRTGPGTISGVTVDAGALGGNRLTTVTIATGPTTAAAESNVGNVANVLSMSSDSGIDATFASTYGSTADLNKNFGLDQAFVVRVLQTDLASVTNVVSVTTTGLGTATASFAVPAGVTSAFDILIPFASFAGGTVSFADIDRLSFTFNPPQNGDWQIQLFGSTAIPEPSALAFASPLAMGLLRRRRA